MFNSFTEFQEDRFILTTEIETEGSKYKITHKVVNYTNKKMDYDVTTLIFEGNTTDEKKIHDLVNSQKQFILKNLVFY